MFKGIFYILSACFIWGLVFALPIYLHNFTSFEIALGRYFFYGIISLILLGGKSFRKFLQLPSQAWVKALLFALVANIVYFTSLGLAIQYASAGMATLIVGTAPVTVALYGNLRQKECSFYKLIIPSVLISLGLVIVNLDMLLTTDSTIYSIRYFLGIIFAVIALLTWTWFVMVNRQFLKAFPSITNSEWASMLGVATLFWVLLLFPIGAFVTNSIELTKYSHFSSDMQLFFAITAILGCLSSWLGSYLWNAGSMLLPATVGGQMTIFETVFGLTFIYLIEQRMPSLQEGIGILMMFAAIIYTVNMFSKTVAVEQTE